MCDTLPCQQLESISMSLLTFSLECFCPLSSVILILLSVGAQGKPTALLLNAHYVLAFHRINDCSTSSSISVSVLVAAML